MQYDSISYVVSLQASEILVSENEVSSLKQKLAEAEGKIQVITKKLRNAKDRERRSKKNLKCAISVLKEKNLINSDLQMKLDQYAGIKSFL